MGSEHREILQERFHGLHYVENALNWAEHGLQVLLLLLANQIVNNLNDMLQGLLSISLPCKLPRALLACPHPMTPPVRMSRISSEHGGLLAITACLALAQGAA